MAVADNTDDTRIYHHRSLVHAVALVYLLMTLSSTRSRLNWALTLHGLQTAANDRATLAFCVDEPYFSSSECLTEPAVQGLGGSRRWVFCGGSSNDGSGSELVGACHWCCAQWSLRLLVESGSCCLVLGLL